MAMLTGRALEIVFSFDTTGSMYSYIEEVKGRLQDLIQRLQADIPGIRIAIFAHGDYCDKRSWGYITKHIDFSTNVAALCKFVKDVGRTGGGDSDECYELVLREVREKLKWSPATNKALVMIGDAAPHAPSYSLNTKKIDWREETKLLGNMGVKIYGVQCGTGRGPKKTFYNTISRKTGGKRIQLKDVNSIFDLMMAVCYREHGAELLQAYEKEVRGRHSGSKVGEDMEGMFGVLRDCPSPPTSVLDADDEPKKLGRKPKTLPLKPKLTKCGSKLVPSPSLKKVKGLKSPTKRSVKLVKKSRSTKKISKMMPLLRRENVPEWNFALGNQTWSAWKVVMDSELPVRRTAAWKKRRLGTGFKVRELFNESCRIALFEVAVQCKKHEKKTVVCFKLSKCDCRLSSWESHLLGALNFLNATADYQVGSPIYWGNLT